ncbi:helix-turn-helix domain-containing protein [Mycobacterium intracellulare]|uniref:helix-turn-helix domain-containing protein n=1 Tax=Mycobacterium intracellulare TaxID=1767 RepID=UPI00109EB0D3|nr:helix-turn-helix transcriptional regulator [Mycobacterium intracellulare]
MIGDASKPLTLGAIIRQQRELLALPLRQLASLVGISNAYLSQIERNLRVPSEWVLEAIACQLHMSPELLWAEANQARSGDVAEVVAAIRRDRDLTNSQRRTLEEMYDTFRRVTREGRRRSFNQSETH